MHAAASTLRGSCVGLKIRAGLALASAVQPSLLIALEATGVELAAGLTGRDVLAATPVGVSVCV